MTHPARVLKSDNNKGLAPTDDPVTDIAATHQRGKPASALVRGAE